MATLPVLLDGESTNGDDGLSSAILTMKECNDEVRNGIDSDGKESLVELVIRLDAEQQTDEDVECRRCQSVEAQAQERVAQLTSKYETEIARLKRELETANKAKETTVMRYAKSENEVIKLQRDKENSSKQITGLMKEIEMLNKKQKMLSSERERLGNIVDGKTCEIQAMQKESDKLKEEISAKDFKIKWTQNKLNAEMELHKETQSRLQKVEAELESLKEEKPVVSSEEIMDADETDSTSTSLVNGTSSEEAVETKEISQSEKIVSSSLSITLKELDAVKQQNRQLVDENNSLSCKVQSLEQQRLELEKRQARLQESNSEHLHQIATLQSELAATESLKLQLSREQESVLALQNECQQLRENQSDVLADMAVCRSKEAELLEYTQKVTEKNVTLQSEFTSVQAKSFALEEENESLLRHNEQLQIDLRTLEKSMSQESKNHLEEKQSVESEVEKQRKELADLQRQLDEAKGEVGLLQKNLNNKIRELTRELQIARRTVKDTASDGMSQSSRASSSSSLNNIDSVQHSKPKHDEIPEKPNEPDAPVIPDQQLLIERIVKLQRTLAKKQEKIEFLQEHVKQLTETVQKKSKVITFYAMNQDIEALSTELSEQNKAEVVKHGGIMASVYASKQSDDGLTLDLSLEINRKLQVVLEDTLLKNMTLKDSLNTLGREISKLTEVNNELKSKLSQMTNTG